MFRAIFLLIITIGLLPSITLARGQAAPAAANGTGTPPEDPNKTKAKEIYKEGQKAFDGGDYDKAAQLFQSAYELDPNPLLMYNIARVYESAYKVEEAITAWKAYVDLTDPRATSKVHALKRVVELQAQLGAKPAPPPSAPASQPAPTCVIILKDVPSDAVAKLNGKEVDTTKPLQTDCLQQAIQIWRGKTQIGGGRQPVRADKETVWVYEPNTPPITDANQMAHPAEDRPLLTRKQWGWSAVAGGGAALAAGGILGFLAHSEAPKATTSSAQDDVKGKMIGANILFGVGVAAGAAGAYLLLWDDDKSSHATIAPSPMGAVLTGTF